MRALVAVLFLTACALPPKVWNKPGASAQDFEMDRGQCQAQAFGVTGMPPMQVAIIYTSCMHGKGWYQTDA